jgi:hypothetical protein
MTRADSDSATFAEEIARWRSDPVYFVERVLGIETLWQKQVEILEAIREHDRVAVAACHSSSKTFSASCAVWWWVLSHQPAKVITTAPTDRQVRQLLWSEIRSRHTHARIPLPGQVQTTAWQYPDQPDWYMVGFSTSPDTAQEHASRFQGYHSPHLLLVFDEASGIERPIWDAADGLTTSGHCKHLAIGNPLDSTSEFARAYRSSSWHSIRIDALEMEHIRKREEHPFLVSWSWVEEMRKKYGEDSPAYVSRVRGLFPDHSDDALIAIRWVEEALSRQAEPYGEPPRSMGVDVARFGSDFTCIYILEGPRVLHAEARSGQDTMWTAGRVLALAREFHVKADMVSVDDTGVGGGVSDRLHEQGFYARPENFGARATDQATYQDRRSELWWGLRDWIRDEACLADAPRRARDILMEDLTAPKYEQRSDGRLKLEAKKDMRKRLGHSPDDGDALALALAHRTRPVMQIFFV